MDILGRGENFIDAMEQSPFADFNQRSNEESGYVNHSESKSRSSLHWIRTADTLIVSKSSVGFDHEAVDSLAALLDAIKSGEITGLKYLVFDFDHGADLKVTHRSEAFGRVIAANAELILNAPVISLAWARSDMRGADLEFAMSCSTIVAQQGARFCFDEDSADSFELYNALAQKIGFAKAERLMENEEVLSAEEMEELFLVKQVIEDDGRLAIERYVEQLGRRYNASCGIFRAQRMSMRRGRGLQAEMRSAA